MYSPLFNVVFNVFFKPYYRSRVRKLWILGQLPNFSTKLPIIIIANHFSWWDGFLIRSVKEYFCCNRQFSFFMGAEQFQTRRWMRWLGAIPMDANRPASVLKAIRKVSQLRREKGSKLFFFHYPEGQLIRPWSKQNHWRRGVELVLKNFQPAECWILAQQLEFGSSPRAAAFLHLKRLGPTEEVSVTGLRKSWLQASAELQTAIEGTPDCNPEMKASLWNPIPC